MKNLKFSLQFDLGFINNSLRQLIVEGGDFTFFFGPKMAVLNKVSVLALASFCVAVAIAQDFYSPGSDARCGRMWDSLNYEGNAVDCTDNERKMNLGPFDCKAQSVFVRDGCTLTVFDKRGCQRQLDRSASCLYAWNNKISAACCECDGCYGEAPRRDLQCARLYQHQKCSSCSGFRLEVNPMDQVPNLHVLNNQISSLIVKPGCTLTVWEGANYTGTHQSFSSAAIDWMDLAWNDRISSLRCSC